MMENDIRAEVIGAWQLEGFMLSEDSVTWIPWGEDIRGLLIYTESGSVSVSINRNVSSQFDSQKDILFYSGSFEVRESTILHHVTIASDSTRIGTTIERTAIAEDGVLTLTGVATSGKRFKLVWTR